MSFLLLLYKTGTILGKRERTHESSSNDEQLTKYFQVTATINDSRFSKAYRATIYKLAQDCKAYYSEKGKDRSIWYEGASRDLSICLLFSTVDDAFNFQNGLSNFRFDHPTFGMKISFEEKVDVIYLSNHPDRVFYKHYQTLDNTDSPPFLSLADIKSSHSTSVLSNDGNPERALQSLEDLTKFPKLKCYWCHLISKKNKSYSNDTDNAIFGSWIFHQYFDALNSTNDYPELAVKFISFDESELILINGETKRKTKVYVRIIFRDEEVAAVMSNYFKNGTERLDDLNYKSFLYANDKDKMKFYLDSKYAETMEIWGNI